MAAAAGKTIPIVFCADAHYGVYIPVILQSVLENSVPGHDYHIIIFDCGIKPDDIAALERQVAECGNFRLRVKDVTEYMRENRASFAVPEEQHISPATYARLLIPQLCAEYDRVIYADIDMVFNADPAALLEIGLGENYIAGVADANIETERRARASIKKYSRETLGLRDDEVYINAGLLVFNAKLWRQNGPAARCLAELAERRFKRHDQDMINFICRGNIHYLDGRWNTACKLAQADGNADKKALEGAFLCHFVGNLKPWHIAPENLPAADAAHKTARKWWACAAKTEIYDRLRQNAALYAAQLNQNLGIQRFCLFGLPLLRVQTAPRKKKYSLLGLSVAKEVINGKTGERVFSLFGLGLRRRKSQKERA